MDMIRVTITGQAQYGRFPYKIDTVGTRLSAPHKGLASHPLLDACKILRMLHAADDDAVIGLYNQGTGTWRQRTTIAYGARQATGVPTDAINPSGSEEVAGEEENEPGASAEAPSAGTATKSAAAPPQPHTPPASPAGKGRAEPAPPKPKHSLHKRPPAKSGARPGRR